MKLRDMSYLTANVTILPSMPNRLLVQKENGSFVAVPVSRFVALMVTAIKEADREVENANA